MHTFEATTLIQRPLADVFAFVADVRNLPRYNPMVTEVRDVRGDPDEIGSLAVTVTRVELRTLVHTWETTGYELNSFLASKTIAGPLKIAMQTTFSATADGTTVQSVLTGALPRILVHRVRHQHEKSIESMRTVLQGE